MGLQNTLSKNIGNYISHTISDTQVLLKAQNANLRLLFYNDLTLRLTATTQDSFEDFSYVVVEKPAIIPFSVTEDDTYLLISTSQLSLRFQKETLAYTLFNSQNHVITQSDENLSFTWQGLEVGIYQKLQNLERFIGLGEKVGNLDRFGDSFVNWNTDKYGYGPESDPLYASFPFYIGIHSGLCYGFFLNNTHKSTFNFGASNRRFTSIIADDGEADFFLFAADTPAEIIKDYTYITGRMQMPPLWSLGLQQCRYSYYPEYKVRNIASQYRQHKIPADVIYLDIHYMDAYKVFTWHPDFFPEPKSLLSDLLAQGFKVVVIIDPGIKIDNNYPIYVDGLEKDLYIKYPDNQPYEAQVWPGWCTFPDFTKPKTRAWWASKFKGLVDIGVKGFWTDMNEPATWGQRTPDIVRFDHDGNPASHKKAHNIYGMQMARATAEGTQNFLTDTERTFILTRAGFSGVQRYAAMWTGDNTASEENMLLGCRLTNAMGLSGMSFVGTDIGGFVGESTKPMFARWVSIGSFMPLFRIHTMIDNKESDPWSYGERVQAICSNYINLRYSLLPYFYSTFYQSTLTGKPIQRSLALDYPHEDPVYDPEFQNQFFIGPSILVAPVASNQHFTKVYLPGTSGYYYLLNDHYYQSPSCPIVESPIEKLPVFIKAGAVIPMQEPGQHTEDNVSDILEVHVYAGGNTEETTHYYEDDGKTTNNQKGIFYKRQITHNYTKRHLTIFAPSGKYKSKFNFIKLALHGFGVLEKIKINNQDIELVIEQINLFKPIPHFDPIGFSDKGHKLYLLTTVVDNIHKQLDISW